MSGKPAPGADAVAQYEELARNASPEDLEQIHAEAFAKLSDDERQSVFDALVERATADDERPADSSPAELARAASAAEARNPGTFGAIVSGRDPFGVDTGLLNTFVAYAVGSQLAFAYLAASPLPDDGGPADFGGGFAAADGFDAF